MHCARPKFGQPSSSSSSSSSPWLSPTDFDGTKDVPDVQHRTNFKDALRHPGRVADRIRAINQLHQSFNTSKAANKQPAPSKLRRNAPSEAPIRRPSPFARRDASQSPIRPDTPLSHSRMPLTTPMVHCPMPRRVQPQLSTAIEQGALPLTNASSQDAFSSKPLEHLICPRHARSLQRRKIVPSGMDKSLSGAYIPIGSRIRQQVDATSPWASVNSLAKAEGTTVSPDLCPDCAAEQEILKQEVEPDADFDLGATTSQPSSLYTERGTPVDEPRVPNVVVGTTDDNQEVIIPGATVSGMSASSFGSIVAADLGDMIDAIIIEHSGTLDKVITNLRHGRPDNTTVHHLSHNLAKVSEAVAALPDDDVECAPAFVRNLDGRRSMILEASPEALRRRAKTMPELLDLIDVTVEQFTLTKPPREEEEFHAELSPMPGVFPPTNFATPISRILTPPASPPHPVQPGSPLLPPVGEPLDADELPSEALLAHNPSPIVNPTILIEPPHLDPKDEAHATASDLSFPILPTPADQEPSTLVDTSGAYRQSRVPKAITLPLARSEIQPSRGMYASQAKPKSSNANKQHKQQHTFQQGWLKEAATFERVQRRSRSRGAAK